MTANPATLRKRNLTAARRSLALVADVVAQHQGLLEDGTVPEGSFLVHAQAYERARVALGVLDSLGEDASTFPETDEITVSRGDLEVMIEMLQEIGPPELMAPDQGSPLGNLIAATGEGGTE